MRLRHLVPAAVLTALGTALLTLNGQPAAGATNSYTVQTLHFRVAVGPADATVCDIVGDLYLPTDASTAHPVPGLLTTNGWGGSKAEQGGIARAFALKGFAVLAYSGLGWGGSSCKVQLADPQWDGKAASRLVSYLGGAPGVAYLDAAHTIAAPRLTVVRRDATDHDGVHRTDDPRVGMIGASYGGGIQFAAASVDRRIDTIVPLATWNDLSYSLAPNGTTTTTGVSTSMSGAFKTVYGAGLLGTGIAGGTTGPTDPERLLGCPNLVDRFCTDMISGATAGFLSSDQIAFYRAHSVASYVSKIKIPVLLGQGETDTLFNLNEAVATFQALKKQGTPVKMIWASWGHSAGSAGAPGEFDPIAPDLTGQYNWQRIYAWFQHHLQDSPVDTGPVFSYFREWVEYTGSAAPAYASSSTFPVGTNRSLYLSGNGTLASSTAAVTSGSQTLLTPPAGVPTSLDPLDVAPTVPPPEIDAPGTAASWTTPVLTSPMDVVGLPQVAVKVDAPVAALTQDAGSAGQVVLFVKLLDVAPDGSASLIRYQNTPVRVPDVTRPVHITLGGIVHRFAAGHRLRLTVAGGSPNFRGNLLANSVTIAAGASQVLTLPVTR